jgi:hypothetical protein
MERKYRATAAAGLAVLLLALVALVVNVSDGVDTVDLLQILKSQDGSVSEGSSKSWDKELKVLKKTYGTEQSLAGKMTSKVDKAMSADKKKLIAAKSLLKDGMEDELTAKMDVDHAGKLRTLAQKLKDESQAARRKFVAQERPVLLAQKLAVHDHKNYRSDELAVAKEVALLSEHPSDKDLRKKVDKLVHRSKDAKKRMGEDGLLLKKLEKKTADAQLGGSKGYSSLKQKSVKTAKKAEKIAETAVSLAKKGHSEKVQAREEIAKVKKALEKPDAENSSEKKVEKKAEQTHHMIRKLQDRIEKEEAAKAAASEKKEAKKKKAKETSYAEERKRLREEVEGKISDDSGSPKAVQTSESDEQKQLKAAKDSYDELEKLEEKKEKARLRREERKDGEDSSKQTESDATDTQQHASTETDKEKRKLAAEKRAHILSERQSTFLSGLFSTKSPWDTKKSI